MNVNVCNYIKDNWKNTIRQPGKAVNGIVKMPFPFTTPCTNEGFVDFYYWDTYFANLGLLHDGLDKQVENNLDTMKFFIDSIGFVPNANNILDRTQPPLFTAGVYDLYQFRDDVEVIQKYADSIKRELEFFAYDRMTPIGLNAYSTKANKAELKEVCKWLCLRIGEEVPEDDEEKIHLARNLYAIAESGWDFNPRFRTEESRFATDEFVHLELNCILYDAEQKAAEMFRVLRREEEAKEFELHAAWRRERMERYMKDSKTGIFLDYNFRRDSLSSVVSCASLYVYAVGISDDKEAAKKVLQRLELPHGIAACEERPGDTYLQWDYPSMWPTNVYFACMGLRRIGLIEDAKRLAKKYCDTVDKCFNETGLLWEKYDATEGTVSVPREYETPAMMGWTAGVYLALGELLLKE